MNFKIDEMQCNSLRQLIQIKSSATGSQPNMLNDSLTTYYVNEQHETAA
jgi:hypothetical protein